MNPSLLLIPDRYKASKLYSQIPDTGAGDLAFTRALDTATRVGADGLIEKVRTNLVLNSATLATQDVTVSANPHTISFFGTGSIVVSGVASGTLVGTGVGDRVELSVTTTAGTLNLTVSGTVTNAQLETGDIATPYIPTTTAAVSVGMLEDIPRIDYTGGGCGKLLLEPQRTNIALFSEQMNNAAWNLDGGSITANQIASPDGFVSADLFSSISTTPAGVFQTRTGLAGGSTYYVTGYAKLGTATNVCIVINDTVAFNTIKGESFDSSDGLNTSTWTRIGFFFTAPAGNNINIHIGKHSETGVTAQSLGTFFFWGCMVELGSYETSYIPTLGAQVTRSADAASKTGISALIGQTEGTLYSEFTINGLADFGTALCLNNGGTGESIWLTTFANGTIRAEVFSTAGGGVQATFPKTGNVVGQTYKIALAYAANNFAFFVNGVQVGTTDTSGSVPVGLSRVDFDYTNSSLFVQSALNIKQALLFKTRLTNAQLAELTA